jgi:type IV pilus assembly protein PilE
MTMKARKQGFTLIELMVVVAVVGILAAIVLPAYNSAMVKNNRSAAQTFMLDIAQRQQQYLLDNRSYGADLAALNIAAAPTTVTDFYTLLITPSAGPPPGFTVTATPVYGTRQAGDGTLSIDQTGAKSPAGKW